VALPALLVLACSRDLTVSMGCRSTVLKAEATNASAMLTGMLISSVDFFESSGNVLSAGSGPSTPRRRTSNSSTDAAVTATPASMFAGGGKGQCLPRSAVPCFLRTTPQPSPGCC